MDNISDMLKQLMIENPDLEDNIRQMSVDLATFENIELTDQLADSISKSILEDYKRVNLMMESLINSTKEK